MYGIKFRFAGYKLKIKIYPGRKMFSLKKINKNKFSISVYGELWKTTSRASGFFPPHKVYPFPFYLYFQPITPG